MMKTDLIRQVRENSGWFIALGVVNASGAPCAKTIVLMAMPGIIFHTTMRDRGHIVGAKMG